MTFKQKFCIAHLAASFIIIFSLLLLVWFYWFPYPLIMLDGAWQVLLMLLVIDLILGPFLAWLVIKAHKTMLHQILDLAFVIVLQLAALGYGIYNISYQRVVALVFLDDYFHLVPYKETMTTDFSNPHLKYYKNVAYGGLTQAHFSSDIRAEIELILYDPEKYEVFDQALVTRSNPQKVSFAPELYQRYPDKTFYKIAGKRMNGVAVVDEHFQIVDWVLD